MTAKDDEDKLLLSVAMQNANSVLLARRRAERRSEAHLAEAQRLSQVGSFDWRVSTGDLLWSDETFRIFQFDRTTKPTMELVAARPEFARNQAAPSPGHIFLFVYKKGLDARP